MFREQIRRTLMPIGCLFALTMLAAMPLQAQGGCVLQVLPGYSFSTYREHVADRFSFHDDISESMVIQERYGVSYKPIYARGGSSISGAVGLECTNPQNNGAWGIRLSSSATSFRTSGLIVTDLNREDVAGVRMWDHMLFPVINDLTEAGVSNVRYWVSAKVAPWSLDAYKVVNFLNTEAVSLSLVAGLRVGGTKLYREEGQTQTAFVTQYFGLDKHLQNTITITGKAETNALIAAGPQFGARLGIKRGKATLTFDGSFAILGGSVREAATWHDVDDFHVLAGSNMKALTDEGQVTLLDGFFPYETKHWTTLSTKDFSVALSYPIAKRISFAPTLVYSGWGNLPAPPRWVVPGEWTLASGSGWQEQQPVRTSTLSLLAGLSIKF